MTKTTSAPKKEKKPKAAKAPKAPAADPVRDGQWTKHVIKNMPANFAGTKEQYVAMYCDLIKGFAGEAEKAIAQLYPEACRVAAIKKIDLETPVVEALFKVKFDFSDTEVAQFTGSVSFEEKQKHTASIGYVHDLNPKAPGKQTDMISNPPTPTSPVLDTKASAAAAPHNKSATPDSGKVAAPRRRAATPPAKPTETAQPGPAKAEPGEK